MNHYFLDPKRYVKPTCDDWGGFLIELTNHCNLNCCFCLNSSSSQKDIFLSFEDFKIIIDKIKHKKELVQLSGGEPITNPSFIKMIDYLREENVIFHVNTNGILVNSEIIDRIKNNPNCSIQMSLDGANALTDDSLRCTGHFEKVVSVMKEFCSPSFRRGAIKMVINRKNYMEVEDNFKLALQYGFLPTYSFLVRSGRAENNWNDLCLSVEEKYGIRELIWELLDANIDYFREFSNPNILQYMRNMNISYVGECQFNLEFFDFTPHIKADGSAYPCQGLFAPEFCLGNILYEDPDFLFSHDNPKVKTLSDRAKERKNVLDNVLCKSCPINIFCGKGCLAESFNEGDFCGKPADCYFRKRDYIRGKVEKNDTIF